MASSARKKRFIMIKILVTFCFFLIAVNANAKTQFEYQNTQESKTIHFFITIMEETSKTVKYLSVGPKGSSEFHINKENGATISWKKTRKNISINAVRKENSIEIYVDENGNITHFKDSNGCEKWQTFDENVNMTYYKDSNGLEESYEYIFDNLGRLVEIKGTQNCKIIYN